MQRELKRQREDLEDTIAVMRKQTNEVKQDSTKYQNEMTQMKMQIDLSRERELLVKKM